MRHEQIQVRDSYRELDVAAVWPSTIQVAPLPIPDIEPQVEAARFRAEAAAPDVPAAVGKLIVGAYVGLIAAFALATTGSRDSAFVIAICAVFLAAFFAVPWLFLRTEPKSGARPTLDRFMREGLVTMTGHTSGKDALVQMLIVPVFLTLGVLAMGIAVAAIF